MQMKIGPYPIHPICASVPDMTGDEYSELIASMRRVGFDPNCPVIVHIGVILDGRHRLKAAIELGIKPIFENFKGTTEQEVRDFIYLQACIRRQLSAGQKAVLALGSLPGIQEEAKARMRAGSKTDPSTGQVLGSNGGGRATEIAAKAVGVGRTSVELAKQIQEAKPELLDEVRAGNITLAEAKRKIEPTKESSDDIKDELGNAIEDESVAEAFIQAQDIADIERLLRSARTLGEAFAKTPASSSFRADQFTAHIGNAFRVLKFAKPYAVCPLMPSCKTGGCKHCDGHGWVAKDTYEHIPSELKA